MVFLLKCLFSKFRKYFVFFSPSSYQRDLDLIIVPRVLYLDISSFWRILISNSLEMSVLSVSERLFLPVSFEEIIYRLLSLTTVISFWFPFSLRSEGSLIEFSLHFHSVPKENGVNLCVIFVIIRHIIDCFLD